jgi:hypothetical protein
MSAQRVGTHVDPAKWLAGLLNGSLIDAINVLLEIASLTWSMKMVIPFCFAGDLRFHDDGKDPGRVLDIETVIGRKLQLRRDMKRVVQFVTPIRVVSAVRLARRAVERVVVENARSGVNLGLPRKAVRKVQSMKR